MDTVSIIAGLGIGAIAGGLAIWLLINSKLRGKDMEIKEKDALVREKETEIINLTSGIASARTALE
ncbi:MAG: hypothetical protein PHD16_05650, partial [Bacteroidales bacterium]|nr:hypothetical protein [Bacteroidales bacterium]